jgi:hypothetical protein
MLNKHFDTSFPRFPYIFRTNTIYLEKVFGRTQLKKKYFSRSTLLNFLNNHLLRKWLIAAAFNLQTAPLHMFKL